MNKHFILAASIAVVNTAYSQCACCAGAGAGSSGGDYSSGSLTLPKKSFVVEGYADYRTIMVEGEGHHESTGTSAEEETPLKSLMINSLGLRYGISNKITISALLPYVFLNTDKGNDKGLGDLILLGTFNVYKKNNLNFALTAGVELPTGVQKGSNFDETTVVVGSGSFDPIGGFHFPKDGTK